MNTELLYPNALAIFLLMSLLWIWSVIRKDASIVDPWWSISFLIVTVQSSLRSGLTPAKGLLLGMVGLWALRLWGHLLLRSRGKPEDPRYTAFRERFGRERYWWVSFFQVFLLQGTLAFFISAPLQLAASQDTPNPITVTDLVGFLVFVIGFAFEAIGDWQLEQFRKTRTSREQVLNTGLWRYTRHPNYFGETVLWWGFWITCLDAPYGWLTFPAPALMTFLLLRVSGVSLLDAHLTNTKPQYAEYIRTTSAFFPKAPKASA
ncbi:MAG: DUF1295 domain-containing protein [Polyangiaceae bacterium]|nr:DUF1295 domain-containing protein [Polyangiaceae bacterium]